MNSSLASSLASLDPTERQSLLESLTEEQSRELLWDWRFWARPNQIAPDGEWQTWLALAGRGFGKTEAGAQWIRERVKGGARSIALVAETQKDLEEVMVARIIAIHPPDEAPSVRFKPVRMVWPNGAVALGYNGTEPNQLRGPEFDTAWVDELAKYRYARETWDMLQFTMRSGDDPRVFVTTTPRPIPVIREILADAGTVVTRGSTFDNAANLPEQFLARLKERYSGTRLGRQELDAEVLDDAPGALWTRAMLDDARARELPEMQRIVVAVDPSGTSGEDGGDMVGIVVAGLGVDGLGYVIADRTISASPSVWGRRAVAAYHEFEASRIVAERNYGGAMVEHVIKAAGSGVAYREVTASRGKSVRAEPIAALYEQRRVKHYGDLADLEDQMCQFTTTGYIGERSPDRADAAIWALTDLFPAIAKPEPKKTPKPATRPGFAPSPTSWMG
ncbi:terminase family protein [Methylobacterium sp. yr596]|uniref:DNA-packaging protein n=1 Tax=Methylobacterium sp. yr596 TaxID=1761800 RepID=UPI0008E53392|nr:terminase family protein [Methylobacterium sp. yr596]SFF76880.1 Large terminase phage packaging protein [Methylobacterium sp. yr596]